MAVTTTQTNKPFNPRGNDQSPKGYNRAALYSGKALDFDGVNDYVEVADNANLSFGDGTTDSPFSITGYFNLDTLGANRTIAAKDGAGINNREYSLFVTSSNKLRFFLKDNGGVNQQSIDSDLVLESGKWYFVSATYDGRGGNTAYQGLNIYVNTQLTGVSLITNDSYTAMTNTTAPFTAGVYSVNWMNGQLSNIKVFAGELTAAQVADLYNNPEKVVPTGVDNTALKLWLPMQEGAGTTAYDGSGNANHGTISGATYTHGIGAPVSQTSVISWNKGTNILPYSEEVNESVWTKTNVTITADQTTAPDGQTTADEVLFLGNGLTQFIGRNATTTANEDYTISVYAKYVDQQWLQFTSSTSQFPAYYANFDIQNGVTGTISGATGSISDAGNGWYRINVTMTAHSSGSNTAIFVLSAIDSGTATRGASLTATNKTAYVWGAQGEQASSVGPYVRTGATAQTSPVLLPQGLTSGRDITGVNLFENVRKQGALNLDGNSWAEVHDNESLDITDAITLETWYYHDTSTTNEGLLGRWNATTSAYLLMKNDTNVRFYTECTSAINVNASVSTEGWHHVVGTYDGTTMRIYLDGSESAIIGQTGSIQTSTFPLEIGRYYDSQTYAQTGAIAQPRIYNRALTAEEVQRNYNAGKNIYTN